LETFIFNETTIEHLHRYAIAKEFVKGKTVLDIACGEGYGTSLLADEALSVKGVDIDSSVIEKAKRKYTKPNLNFLLGSTEQIPFVDQSFEVVTSFETIEHTSEHEKMMSEIKRVLKPNGLLIISTPDKLNYADKRNHRSPFHIKELYSEQFHELISMYFTYHIFMRQLYTNASVITSDNPGMVKMYKGNFEEITVTNLPDSLYLIAFASDKPVEISGFSIFDGGPTLDDALRQREHIVRNTLTYRTGHLLLLPLKFIIKLFRKL